MQDAFGHVTVLVVVLNAIGLGTLMIGIATFLRKPPTHRVIPSGVLIAWSVLHLYLHVMLWWRFYGMPLVESFNFFSYLFMLAGPMALLFGSALLLPEEEDDGTIDMPAHLERIYRRFFVFEAAFWAWVLLLGPLVSGKWVSVWYLWSIMVAISLALVVAKSPRWRVSLTVAAWGIQLVFMATEALKLRAVPVD